VHWLVPIITAVPAIIAALVITFSSDHSPVFGFWIFSIYALVAGVAGLAVLRWVGAGLGRVGTVTKSVVQLIAGVAALVTVLLQVDALELQPATALLALTIGVTFLITGIIDAGVGAKLKDTDRYARDWMTTGLVAVVAAVAIVAVPSDYAIEFTPEPGVTGYLTASIIVIGIFGAALAINGVLAVLGGVSLAPQRDKRMKAEA